MTSGLNNLSNFSPTELAERRDKILSSFGRIDKEFDRRRKENRLLVKAENPVVLTEAAGREVETFEALVALSERIALPVVETSGALFANFPKNHPMHQGHDFTSYKDASDLVIVIRTRAPWYPPSDGPSPARLGHHSAHPAVQSSGLWNVNDVDATYDPAFLDLLAEYVGRA